MASPTPSHAVDARHARWAQLLSLVQAQRLIRVVAPAGYDKSAFAAFVAEHAQGPVTRVDFDYNHHSLRRALEHLCAKLELDADTSELPNLLAATGKPNAAAYARALSQDMSQPALDGRVLILDGLRVLDREVAAVLVQLTTAEPLRVHVIACVRHPSEFPARELWNVPTYDITERELAYTPNELRTLDETYDDPFGYPALAHAVMRGTSPELHMKRLVSLLDADFLNELARASLLPNWPPDADLARVLKLRPTLVEHALSVDLPVIRTDPTDARYVPHPALHDALSAHLDLWPQLRQDAHARLAAYNATRDPVLAIRHAALAEDAERAISIAEQWLGREDPEASAVADDLVLELLPFESSLPGRLRLHLADVLASNARNAEAIAILKNLRSDPQPDVPQASVSLSLARIYALTGAYAPAFSELRETASTSTDPYVRSFAALLLAQLHARGGVEFITGHDQSILEQAHAWSADALRAIQATPTTITAPHDTELMALVVQTYLNHWAARSMAHLKLRLELLLIQARFSSLLTGDALLLLHRIMVDHGHVDLAASALDTARQLLRLTRSAQTALLAAEGRAALRNMQYESAVGSFLLALDAVDPSARDRMLDSEIALLILCALLCLPDTPAADLWHAQERYARAVAFTATPAHEANRSFTMLLCQLRDQQGGEGLSPATLLQMVRVQVPTLISLRCETAPVALFTVAPEERPDRDLSTERIWQVQDMARILGVAVIEAYRSALAPDFQMYRSVDLRVQLIGTPVVEVNGVPVPLTARQVLIIAYLAVTRDYVDRKTLADALYDSDIDAVHSGMSRLRKRLRDLGLSEDLIGQMVGRAEHGILHTVRHHRLTLDLDQYANPGAGEAFWRALGPRGLANLMSGHSEPWVDQLRDDWARRCPRPD